ncbi:DUF6452 family protein [Flavobacterium sp.]|uniref:DUF6452 family protein n=1 Tax=Flavobacterium sp. TaxID=239 RepID=UPI003A950958
MKKIITVFLLALLTAVGFWSCEKDDICAEGTATTPSLIIEFYNRDNRTDPKNVTYFSYFSANLDTIGPLNSENRIEVPLRTDTTATTWNFRLGSSQLGEITYNTDVITFNYETKELYISRACGFKSYFTLNSQSGSTPQPVVIENPEGDDDLWMQDYTIEESNIENEDEVHVKIYF